MLLVDAHVKLFRSVEDSTVVPVDPTITVLVGQNESGKTAFLQALYKARAIGDRAEYDIVEDYPLSSCC